MLATVTIASQHADIVAVWIGSTIGMVAADGLAIIVGRTAALKFPERTIRYFAAAVFLVTGLVNLARAFS